MHRFLITLVLASSLCLGDGLRPLVEVDLTALDGRADTWLTTLFHLHSAANAWRYAEGGEAEADASLLAKSDLGRWLRQGRRSGLDALVFTEHNSIAHRALADSLPEDAALLLCGLEFSGTRGHGHMNLVPPPDSSADCPRPVDARAIPVEAYGLGIARCQEGGGFAVVNHPFHPSFPWPDASTLGALGIEVFGPLPGSLKQNLAWWQECLLAEQRPIFPIAGSDFHPLPLLRPGHLRWLVNRVRVTEATPAALHEGLRAGRIVAYRFAPWTAPEDLPSIAIVAGPGLTAGIGETVKLAGPSVRLQIHLTGARGFRAHIFDETSAEPIYSYEVSDEVSVRAFEKDVAGAWGFVRVQIERRLEHAVSGLVCFER